MKILWIGNHEEGVIAFRETARTHGIGCFITLDDSAFSKRSAGTRIYRELCQEHGIPYHTVDTIKGRQAYEIVASYQPDLMVVLGWSEILPEALLELPTIGTVGTHAALLPHNRGSAPVNWALIHGEEITGNTMMWLSKGVDTGDIVDQIAFPITRFDTCKTLYDQVALTNATMLSKLIDSLRAGKKPVLPIRNHTDEPILPRRRPKDGLIFWNQESRRLYDFVRALTKPYPGAFTYLNGEKWLIWEAACLPVPQQGIVPGTIVGTSYGFAPGSVGLVVAASDAYLLVTQMEDASGNLYSGEKLYQLSLKGVFTHA